MCGDTYAPGQMLLADASLCTEASDCHTLACALFRSFGQLAFLHNPICKHSETIAVVKTPDRGDPFSCYQSTVIVYKTKQFVNIVIDG